MKTFLWTTIAWLIIFFGIAFYAKFDTNMWAIISNWLGTTTITTSGEVLATTWAQSEVMSGITAIQTTLLDMQATLNTLVGETVPTTWTTTVSPVVEQPTPAN